jgi:hypothetical protein
VVTAAPLEAFDFPPTAKEFVAWLTEELVLREVEVLWLELEDELDPPEKVPTTALLDWVPEAVCPCVLT